MPPLDRRFLFVSGKGGVGKTTVSVALARALARAGRRVLVALTDTGTGTELLGLPSDSGGTLHRSADRVWATLIEPKASLREYGSMVLRSSTAYRALFENRYSQSFLAAVPGLYQWAVLGKAWFHSQERMESGEARFDCVILDAPATGHGLQMLRVPKLITEIAPKGLLRRDAELAWQTFSDPARSGVVVVTLPEELAVSETLELVSEVERLALPVAGIFVNATHEPLFDAQDGETLGVARQRAAAPLRELLSIGHDRALREASERRELARLAALGDHPQWRLPWCREAALGLGSEVLEAALFGALAAS